MKVFILAAGVLLATACTTSRSTAASAIREADERMVANCEFVAVVSGSSSLSMAAAAKGRENAKTAALEDAARQGATHIVWGSISTVQGGGASASGRAYRCR